MNECSELEKCLTETSALLVIAVDRVEKLEAFIAQYRESVKAAFAHIDKMDTAHKAHALGVMSFFLSKNG